MNMFKRLDEYISFLNLLYNKIFDIIIDYNYNT